MHKEIYDLLKTIKFPKIRRKGVSDASIESITLGYTHRPFSNFKGNTIFTEKHKFLFEKLSEYAASLDPNHMWSSITINHNVKCKSHKDKKNDGTTMIVGVGDYTGGGLYVDGIGSIDIRESPFYFNGYLTEHHTEDWVGDRYVLMFYSIRKAWDIVHRPEDIPIIKEVFHGNAYHNREIGFGIEKDDEWIDIGAHIGCFSKKVNYYGAKCTSYEPNEETFKYLVRNVSSDRCLNIAITSDGSKYEMLNGGKSYFSKTSENVNGKKSISFDSLDKIGKCIKMDIEGDEISILDKCDFTGIKKMVIAYHTNVDRDKYNLETRLSRLRKFFRIVKHQNLDRFKDRIDIFPNEIFIYCMN